MSQMCKFLRKWSGIFFLLLAAVLCVCGLFVTHPQTELPNSAPTNTPSSFFLGMVCNARFVLLLAALLVLTYYIWQNGYELLERYKQQSRTIRIALVIVPLLLFFLFSCYPQSVVEHQLYGVWFVVPFATMAVSFMVVVVSFWHIVCRKDKPGQRTDGGHNKHVQLLFLAKLSVFVWSCGWVVYFLAIGLTHQPHVGAEVLLRSAICSLDLFMLDIDSNVIDAIQPNDVLKGMVACISFAAASCMTVALLSLVFSRLNAYLHVKHIKITPEHNHLYIFFGLHEAARLLAKNILKNDAASVVIYVENSLAAKAEDEEGNSDGWKSIVSMITHKRKTFAEVEEDERTALAIADCSMQNVDNRDVWKAMGLNTIRQHLETLASLKAQKEANQNGQDDATTSQDDGHQDLHPELHIFFLSDNYDDNVLAAVSMSKDKTVSNDIAGSGIKTVIYCQARREAVNTVVEDIGMEKEVEVREPASSNHAAEHLKSKVEVRVLDSSNLAVELLKSNVENHPVRFVDVATLDEDNPGSVKSDFVSLVVGFGETGQDAVRFLYEFGAFAAYGSSVARSFRSPFECHVVDANMANVEGPFVASAPNVHFKLSTDVGRPAPVSLHQCDYRTAAFYDLLKRIATRLNYVVVALGNDEENLAVAVEILRYVRQRRADLNHFRIYVRAYEKGQFKHMERLVRHFNTQLNPKGCEDKTAYIRVFGQTEEIYTYRLIVKNQYDENARHYYETYRKLKISTKTDEGDWESRRRKILTGGGIPCDNYSKLRRKEVQDRSNALHAATKIALLCAATGEERAPDKASCPLAGAIASNVLAGRSGKYEKIHYPRLTLKENHLLLNLAITEHLRWEASHEMMGYMPTGSLHKCDERTKRHNCMKPWQELDKESRECGYWDDNGEHVDMDYKLFDYGVVETSMKLW